MTLRRALAAAAAGVVLGHLGVALILGDWNPGRWPREAREICVVASVLIALMVAELVRPWGLVEGGPNSQPGRRDALPNSQAEGRGDRSGHPPKDKISWWG